MKLYVQLMIIFAISLKSEMISTVFSLPIPGGIIGLLLLFLALELKWLRLRHVSMVGNFLLANMTILFLPAAVGIMDRYDVIAPYIFPIVVIILGATVLNVVIIAFVVRFIKERFESDCQERSKKQV